jgi:hypothetical protein
MNYDEMSDFEVNCKVAEVLGKRVAEIDDSSTLGMTTKYHEEYPNTVWVQDMEPDDTGINRPTTTWYQYSPCNSWEDIGPIIDEYNISIMRDWNEKDAYSGIATRYEKRSLGQYFFTVEAEDESPKRAAAIAFLKMKEADEL